MSADCQISADEAERDLSHHPCPVAGSVGGLGPPMIESGETFDCEPGHPVRGTPIACREESDATGVMLEPWIMQWGRQGGLGSRERPSLGPVR